MSAHAKERAVVIGPGMRDPGAVEAARMFGLQVDDITAFRLVHVRGELADVDFDQLMQTLCVDPVGGWWEPAEGDDRRVVPGEGAVQIETGLRPGVTDREGAELVRAAADAGLAVGAATIGTRWIVDGALSDDERRVLADRVLHNEVIERWALGHLQPSFVGDDPPTGLVETIELGGLDAQGLAKVNADRRLGMDPQEMVVVQDHFAALGRPPTDCELEMIAQTWSEHCAHKTFRALIDVTEPDGSSSQIDGLLKTYLRSTTDEIAAPWVHSAFVDNAGIVEFDEHWDLALKAETHNHPSALEPFGGANTGVGGVVRDILGVSAKPIAVTDILCFGPEDLDPAELPDGVLHPRRIRDGVVAGVGDYGNKIGVPNLAGAIVHDPRYTATPLVFAGCIGLLPTGSNPTDARSGDSIVVLGGAVGRDGVGGATFSSQTMGAHTAEVAGSSVQIGDPIVEKGLIDVVLEARDRQLYTAITDCGAGGLSSAVGEMAERLGAEVDLALVPRKYPGLVPWEVWLSEAQERMVLACPDPAPVLDLAARWGVDASVIGSFTGNGTITVIDSAADAEPLRVIDLSCEFLHDGRPRRRMSAVVSAQSASAASDAITDSADPAGELLELLAHPSIRSNETVIRTYDHEIMGGTLIRPYGGPCGDGPADGTAQIPPGTGAKRALALGIGINALIGELDSYAMAWHVIDEAVRNAVLAGADPARLSLLDNFAWGRPTEPETLGQIVAACRACRDAALAFGAPFVSGKDSLYNEFVHPDGTTAPVAPTLVITAVGVVDDPRRLPVTGAVAAGDELWLVGPLRGALGGSHYEAIRTDLSLGDAGPVPAPDTGAIGRHRVVADLIADGVVRAGHDLSEGGLAVAAAEFAFAGRLGVEFELEHHDVDVLFGEGAGRYLLEVPVEHSSRLAGLADAQRVGRVTGGDRVVIGPIDVTIDAVSEAFTGHQR